MILGDSHEHDEAIEPFDRQEIDDLILREVRKVFRVPDWAAAERWHGVYAKCLSGPVFEAQPGAGGGDHDGDGRSGDDDVIRSGPSALGSASGQITPNHPGSRARPWWGVQRATPLARRRPGRRGISGGVSIQTRTTCRMPPHQPAGIPERAVSPQRRYHKGDVRCVPRFLTGVPPAARGPRKQHRPP